MNEQRISFLEISVKTIVVHTVTYFFMGLLAFQLLDYETRFADPSFNHFMRQTSDVIVMMGPLFQPIRGFLFGIVFFLLRDTVFKRKNGWLVMWIMLFILGILSTFGPAPGSIEGLIYTIIPISMQIVPLSEIILQSFFLSVLLCYWVNYPEKKWISIVFGILFFIVIILPLIGLIMA